MSGIPLWLRDVVSVAVAEIDADGTLRDANEGFLRLLPEAYRRRPRGPVSAFLLQPPFGALITADAAEAPIFLGLVTLGDPDGRTVSLRGSVRRLADGLFLVAEHDIAEFERIEAAMHDLNRQLEAAQRNLIRANRELQRREAEVTELSLTDPLTRLGNRRRLEVALDQETARADRYGGELSMILVDLDHFKAINDTWGHPAGDAVLSAFADILREELRRTDVAARYGGEEFCVLMPETPLAAAAGCAERIRLALAARTIPPLDQPVTASFGVAARRPSEFPASLLQRADEALYAAKEGGRDCVVCGD